MSWITLSLFIALGFLLILVEIFLIPGFTVFGIAGLLLVGGGIIYGFFELPLIQALGLLAGSGGFTIVFLLIFFKSGAHKRFLLTYRESGRKGFQAFRRDYSFLLNQTGKAVTPLRPAGTILIGEEKYDGVSEGDFINAGEPVQVIRVEGYRIVVRKSQNE